MDYPTVRFTRVLAPVLRLSFFIFTLFTFLGSAVFWVIGASFFFIGLHAAFYNFDALDLDSDTQQLTGDIVEEV